MITIILGKRSYLSQRLKSQIVSSKIFNFKEFKDFNIYNEEKFNLIINSFYPTSKLNKIESFNDFSKQSIGNLSDILDIINKKKINKILYSSSASIYGSIIENKYVNDDNNRILYASTKLLCETLLNNFCSKNKIQLLIARVFNMYGDDENFSIIHKLLETKNKNKKVTIYNNGNAVRDFIHVDDICDIYSKILNIKKNIIFDVGSGYGTKIQDIIQLLKIPTNKISYKKNKINEINYSIANLSVIQKNIKKKNFLNLETFIKKKIKLKTKDNKLIRIQKEYPNTINNFLNGSVIYGCGFAGKKLAKKIIERNQYNVSFFVDDNPNLIGKKYLGKRILSSKELFSIAKRKIISNIIIAIPSMKHEKLMNLYDKLFPITQNITALPSKQKLFKKNQVGIEDIKNIELGDILKRKIFDIDKNSLKYFKQKIIMVTGGAGSIGSEISKQLSRSNPKKLIIIDNSEYNLFKLKQELGLKKNITYLLLDIINEEHLKNIIKKNKIKYIFHAAAYKHVSILEENLFSAVQNNILATVSLLNSIKGTNINFTLISTDKAVNPKNILGSTKRASEIITLSKSNELAYKKTNLSVVRFGNVFGSSGSAIEIFKKQIQNNSPITLTDSKMTRYFMSIREACNLVLQTSRLNYRNSIYVLNMGKPIKIVEIIKKIHQKIYNQNRNINIKIIGKNKAEKFHEKLTSKKLKSTSLENISFTKEKSIGEKNIEKFLNELNVNMREYDQNKILILLKKFVKKYS